MPILTAEQLNEIGKQSGYTGGSFSSIGLPTVPQTTTSESLGSTPSFNLPQQQPEPDYTSIIGSIPTVQQITAEATKPTETEKTQLSITDRIMGLIGRTSGKQQAQLQAEQTAGLPDFSKQLTDVTSQLQTLQKEALAIPLQIQENFAGRGATQAGVAPIQTGQLRKNAIQALGLSAIAQTLQGNIATARATADRAVELEFAPAEAELSYLKEVYAINRDILEREDKKRSIALQVQLNERERILADQKQERKAVQDIGMQLASFGVDNQTIQKVLASRNANEALSIAGSQLQDPAQKLKLESIRLDNVLTKAQIAKSNYELRLLQEYDGLSPSEYAKKLADENKAIQEARDETEKQRLQAQALGSKVTLLGSVLDSSAIDSVVGPNVFSRAATGLGGLVGRLALGGITALQGSKDYFTGAPEKLIGQTEQFISKEFLQNLIDVKAQGATFGALQKAEQDALTAAATYIGQRRVFSGKGEDKIVVGYDMSEKDFRKELQTIQDLTRKAYERAIGKSFGSDEESTLDSLFGAQLSPEQYYGI